MRMTLHRSPKTRLYRRRPHSHCLPPDCINTRSHHYLLTFIYFCCVIAILHAVHKRQTRAMCGWLCGFRPKSVTAGLGCGLGCTTALSETIAQRRHVQQLRRYINKPFYNKRNQRKSMAIRATVKTVEVKYK